MKPDPVNGLIAAATGLWCFQQMSLLQFIPNKLCLDKYFVKQSMIRHFFCQFKPMHIQFCEEN